MCKHCWITLLPVVNRTESGSGLKVFQPNRGLSHQPHSDMSARCSHHGDDAGNTWTGRHTTTVRKRPAPVCICLHRTGGMRQRAFVVLFFQVAPPRVKECAVQMECKLKHVYDLHDR